MRASHYGDRGLCLRKDLNFRVVQNILHPILRWRAHPETMVGLR
jgi:hypothetical protein